MYREGISNVVIGAVLSRFIKPLVLACLKKSMNPAYVTNELQNAGCKVERQVPVPDPIRGSSASKKVSGWIFSYRKVSFVKSKRSKSITLYGKLSC